MGVTGSRSTSTDNNQHNDDHHEDHNISPVPFEVNQYLAAMEQCQFDASFFLNPNLLEDHNQSYEFDLIAFSATASALLKANDALSAWRYRLVPSKINEYTFWRHTFHQLDTIINNDPNSYHIDDKQTTIEHGHEENDTYIEQSQDEDEALFTTADLTNQPNTSTDSDDHDASNQSDSHQSTQLTSETNSERVIELEAQVRSLQNELATLRAQLDVSTPSTCSRCIKSVDQMSLSTSFHSGVWQPDQGTLDFLSLDDELKANLRREKEKRLNAVNFEMRWICDTNDATSGSGAWSCCKKEYRAEGCSNQTNHLVQNSAAVSRKR